MGSVDLAGTRGAASAGTAARALSWLFPLGPRADGWSSSLRVWMLRLLALAGLASLAFQARYLFPPHVYTKDFKQEYMLARATLDRVNPYLSAHELASRYLPESLELALPSLHPPAVAVFAAPIGLLPYRAAAAIWLLFELLLLLALAAIAVRSTSGGTAPWRTALLTWCILLLWRPVIEELAFGQLGLLLAVLLAWSWVALESGRRGLAGTLVGAAAAIKLFPAVVVGYLLVRRQWATALVGGAMGLLLTGLAGIVIGIEGVTSYVAQVHEGTSFLAAEHNCSLHGAVLRIFTGGLLVQPLIDAPAAGRVLATMTTVAVCGATGWCIWHARDARLALAGGIVSLVVAGPLSWRHYQVLLIWPLFVLGQRLRERGWPPVDTWLAVVGVVIPTIPGRAAMMTPIEALWTAVAGPTAPTVLGQTVPAIAMLPYELEALGPALVLLAILRQTRAPADAGRKPPYPAQSVGSPTALPQSAR